MAEMSQLEAMQELEKHLTSVRQLQTAAGARSDAAQMAAYLKVCTIEMSCYVLC